MDENILQQIKNMSDNHENLDEETKQKNKNENRQAKIRMQLVKKIEAEKFCQPKVKDMPFFSQHEKNLPRKKRSHTTMLQTDTISETTAEPALTPKRQKTENKNLLRRSGAYTNLFALQRTTACMDITELLRDHNGSSKNQIPKEREESCTSTAIHSEDNKNFKLT